MRKSFALLVLTLAVSSLIAVKLARASITKPSIPEFTLKPVDHSYDVPTTYSIDPYTGENVTHPGYHVEKITLDMTIKNQPFAPYYNASSGWNIEFYYNIRIKGYYSEDWIELYRASDGYPTQSDSEYTVISLGTLGENGLSLVTNAKSFDVPSGGQVDFQVEAMIGYVSRSGEPPWFPWEFTGETSGWSNTQTLTLPIAANAPIISVLSPQEKNYTTSEVPLTFEVDKQFSQVEYSLDGQENVTITGNTTLAGLSNGSHNITVYAWDLEGNVGASETVYFTIAQQSEPFPTTGIAAAITIIAIGIVAAILLHFRKIKKTIGKDNQVKEGTNNIS